MKKQYHSASLIDFIFDINVSFVISFITYE